VGRVGAGDPALLAEQHGWSREDASDRRGDAVLFRRGELSVVVRFDAGRRSARLAP
jgi:hypothetical protein